MVHRLNMAATKVLLTCSVQQTCRNITNTFNFTYRPILCNNFISPKCILCTTRQYHSNVYSRCESSTSKCARSVVGRDWGLPVTAARLPAELGRWGQQSIRLKRTSYRNQESDEEDSDSDVDDNDGNFGPHYEEDGDFPDNYKEVKKYVTSLRADAILGGGLNMSRKKIDDYFLASKLRLNGSKVLKKSKQMEAGDCIDLIVEVTDDMMKVKRVRLVKVAEKKSSKDRHLAYLRAWRAGVSLPREENTKWTRH